MCNCTPSSNIYHIGVIASSPELVVIGPDTKLDRDAVPPGSVTSVANPRLCTSFKVDRRRWRRARNPPPSPV